MRDSDGMEIFESYLRDVKRSSQNTISSYLRDIRQLSEYLHAHTDADLGSAEEEELCDYIDWMRSNGKSVATVSRAIASLKNFYGFLLNNHYVQHNPTGKLVPDKAKQKLPQILSSKEVELLLDQPKPNDLKGCRDKAMLEVLYATGIRVSELIGLNVDDVSLTGGFLRCASGEKLRLIPLYPEAVSVLRDYIENVRPSMVAAPGERSLFVNVSGERMSRPKLTGARYPIGSPSTSSPTCPSSKPWQKWSVRSVNSRSGNAVFRAPVTYSSTAAGDNSPSMSISPSRFFIRAGSSGSVRPSTQQTVTFVSDRLPTTDSSSRSSGVRRWRRIRLVLTRMVSTKASFGPFTVFSTSGEDGPRLTPVFTSKARAPVPGNRTMQ